MANLKKSVDDILSNPPAPIFDARYIVLPTGTGAWAGHDNEIAKDDGAGGWGFDVPQEGWFLYVKSQERIYIFNGTEWIPASISFSDDPALDTTFGGPDAGISTLVSRADHVHSLGTEVAPEVILDAVTTAGTSDTAARADHIHGVSLGSPIDVGNANADGVATSLSRSDHTHHHGQQTATDMHAEATPTTAGFMSAQDKDNLDTVVAAPPGLGLSNDNPEDIGTAAPGVGASASRSDHVHAHGDQGGGTEHADVVAGAPGTSGFMTGTQADKLAGIADNADVSPVTSVHGRTGAVVGASGDYDFAQISGEIDDTQHGDRNGGTLHAEATTTVPGFLSAADKTKLDGLTGGPTLSDTTPADLGTAAPGVGTLASRDDHVHAHGDQVGGTLHSEVIANGDAGFMSGADKDKLDNLTPGGGGREFPAASGFSAAVGGNQNGISNNDVVLIFVLEWEDEPDWTGYQAIGSNTGEGTVTSLRTGRYAFDLDLHFLRQESGDKDLFLEWKINGVVVKEMWQFLSRLSLSRFNMKWVGWLNIESGDELELFFRNPADGPGTEDFTLEMGKQFLRLTRLD